VKLFGTKPPPAAESGIDTLRDRLTLYDERLRAVERGHKDLLLEWENAYDKLHKGLSRLNKRARDLAKADDAAGATNAEGSDQSPTPHTELRDRVLKRRRHG